MWSLLKVIREQFLEYNSPLICFPVERRRAAGCSSHNLQEYYYNNLRAPLDWYVRIVLKQVLCACFARCSRVKASIALVENQWNCLPATRDFGDKSLPCDLYFIEWHLISESVDLLIAHHATRSVDPLAMWMGMQIIFVIVT